MIDFWCQKCHSNIISSDNSCNNDQSDKLTIVIYYSTECKIACITMLESGFAILELL